MLKEMGFKEGLTDDPWTYLVWSQFIGIKAIYNQLEREESLATSDILGLMEAGIGAVNLQKMEARKEMNLVISSQTT